MEKQIFDEAGLQSLLLELYALSDQSLNEEAAALLHQPKLWINGHFELDSDQLEYLQNLPATVTNFLAEQGSFAIRHRLPINLDKHQISPKNGDKEQDKVFKPTSNLAVSTNSEGTVTASGELTIEVTYIQNP